MHLKIHYKRKNALDCEPKCVVEKMIKAFKEKKKAKEVFDFVIKTVGKHSLLGEQVDNSTLKANWVIGLGWSHAMFVIVLEKLYEK